MTCGHTESGIEFNVYFTYLLVGFVSFPEVNCAAETASDVVEVQESPMNLRTS